VSNRVADAAARLVAAFGEGRVNDYFDCFAADASFVFYTTPERLESRAAYRSLWHRWESEDGFRVLECESSNPLITPVGDDAAVFVHDVATVVSTNAGGRRWPSGRRSSSRGATARGWRCTSTCRPPYPERH
jgi:hypothetical protein